VLFSTPIVFTFDRHCEEPLIVRSRDVVFCTALSFDAGTRRLLFRGSVIALRA